MWRMSSSPFIVTGTNATALFTQTGSLIVQKTITGPAAGRQGAVTINVRCGGVLIGDHHVCAPTAFQLFTLGIPCIYYGTEQAFAGPAQSQWRYLFAQGWQQSQNWADRYLREAMFGPDHPRADHHQPVDTQLTTRDESLPGFGPFGTAGAHAFDPTSPGYVRIAALCAARAAHAVLRIGRQYPRQLRLPHTGFDPPAAGELVAWSRILDDQEAVVLVNPNGTADRGGDVVIAAELSAPGTDYVVIVNTAQTAASASANPFTGTHPLGERLPVLGRGSPGQPAFVQIRDVSPAEVVVPL